MATLRKNEIILDLETSGGPLLLSFKDKEVTIAYYSQRKLAQKLPLDQAETVEYFDTADQATQAARERIYAGDVFSGWVEVCVRYRARNFQGQIVTTRERTYDVNATTIIEWSKANRVSGLPNLLSQVKHPEPISD